jgi:ABC-type nitrate/sulfonate/bicarbonate transport system ATPase subunit
MVNSPTRTDTLLSINNVTMAYGENVVLRDIKIGIQDLIRPGIVTGQIVGLVGPSGIGKTTLLRIIAGLQKPTSGTILLGKAQTPVRAGDVGVVSQNYILYRNRDVMSNLVIAAKQAKDKPTDIVAKQRAGDMLNDFGLLDKAHLYPCQLSGGQRQRVAIGQQILASGDFLLMDEPTAGLDPIAKDTVCDLITRVGNRSEVSTLVICSHDIPSLVAVCDTLWVLGRTTGKPGASIGATYDLAARNLTWEPGIRRSPQFTEVVEELQYLFRSL